jgi:hypothetical protein
MSARPFIGSRSRPREARLRESAMALQVKSRPRRSSWMVAGEICGFAPLRVYFYVRDMAICAVTPAGNSRSTDVRCSSTERVLAPAASATA